MWYCVRHWLQRCICDGSHFDSSVDGDLSICGCVSFQPRVDVVPAVKLEHNSDPSFRQFSQPRRRLKYLWKRQRCYVFGDYCEIDAAFDFLVADPLTFVAATYFPSLHTIAKRYQDDRKEREQLQLQRDVRAQQ